MSNRMWLSGRERQEGSGDIWHRERERGRRGVLMSNRKWMSGRGRQGESGDTLQRKTEGD